MTPVNQYRGRATCQLSARRFIADETGSATVESVIWFPIFAVLLAFIMNLSLLFFSESQMLRVMQDANRAFSLGRMENTTEVEDYILAQLAYLEATLTVTSTVSDGYITTDVSTPARDLMPLNFMTQAFDSVSIAVRAQHIIEF